MLLKLTANAFLSIDLSGMNNDLSIIKSLITEYGLPTVLAVLLFLAIIKTVKIYFIKASFGACPNRRGI